MSENKSSLSQRLRASGNFAADAPDVWPSIARQLSGRPPSWSTNPFSMAAAALLLLMFGGVGGWQLSQFNQQADKQLAMHHSAPPHHVYQAVVAMEQDVAKAKALLWSQINSDANRLPEATIRELSSNLMIIEQASADIKSRLMAQPEREGQYSLLLKSLYEKEIAMLQTVSMATDY